MDTLDELEPDEPPYFIALVLGRPRGFKFKADRKRRSQKELDQKTLEKEVNRKELLSALHSDNFDENKNEVYFLGFILHVGNALRRVNMFHPSRLFEPERDHTLVVYFDSKSTDLYSLPVRTHEDMYTIFNRKGDMFFGRFIDT